MNVSDLRRNFPPGVEPPALLVRLLDYQNAMPDFQRVDDLDFQVYDCGEGLLYWFGHDPAAAAQFAAFGHSQDGSTYAYWLYPGRTLADAPLVLLDGDGDGRLLADTTAEFLALLAAGEVGPGAEGRQTTRPSPTLLGYRRWLAEDIGIPVPADGRAIREKAKARHPDLNDWIAQWQRSQQA